MKKLITTAIFSFAVLLCMAQQEQQYTQFMYNKLHLNPGYAGSHDAACITALIRSQWIGLEGAPKTQLVSFNTPLLNKRVGVGITLLRHTIGITTKWTAEGSYAYRIRLARGELGLGVQASVRYFGKDFSDPRLVTTTGTVAGDGSIPDGTQSKYVPNFGAGIYYQTNKFYFGVSVPRLLNNNIDFSSDNIVVGKEALHLNVMAGYDVYLNDDIKLKPQVLVKYAQNSPLDADINLSLVYKERYSLGATYRLGGSTVTGFGESIDLLLAAQITDNLLFGLGYDITLSDIKDYNDGSIEALLRYCFGKSEGEDIINPRFF